MKDIAGALHPSARSGDPRTAATRDHHRWAAAAEDPAGGDDDNTHYCTCGNKHKGDCHFDGVPCTEEQFNAIRKAFRQPQHRPSRNAAEAEDADFRTADSAVMVAAPHVASTRSVYQRKTRSAGTCQCA